MSTYVFPCSACSHRGSHPFLSCAILAAGESKRMGKANKLMLPYQGKALVSHGVEKLLMQPLNEILLISGYQYEKMAVLMKPYPIKVVFNANYSMGQSSSLITAIEHLAKDSKGVLFYLADQPRITLKTLMMLIDAFMRHPQCIIAPLFGNRRGHPVIIPRTLFAEIRALKGDMGAKNILQKHSHNIHCVRVSDRGTIDDVDTPKAYQRLTSDERMED